MEDLEFFLMLFLQCQGYRDTRKKILNFSEVVKQHGLGDLAWNDPFILYLLCQDHQKKERMGSI